MWGVLSIGLLAVHLLATNVAAAGPLVWASFVGGGGPRRLELAQRAARLSLAGLLVGIVLGAALLARPSPGLSSALRRFPASAYWFGAAELAFSAAVMIGLLAAGRRCQGRPWLAWILAIVTASNLLYHFPPWMAVIGRLAAEPRWATEEIIPRAALVQLSLRPEILSLWIHYVLASIAAAAVAVMWPTTLRPTEADADGSLWRRLAAAALGASMLQLPVGAWVAAASSPAMRNALLGGEIQASFSLLAGVLVALWLMHLLAAIALGETSPVKRRLAGCALVVVVALMTATLVAGRRAAATRRPSDAAPAAAATAIRPNLPAPD